MNSRERVKRAVKMQNPDRLPLLYACTLEDSDIINVEVVRHFTGIDHNKSEWGFEWSHIDKSLAMGQPKYALIKTWDDLDSFKAPDSSQPSLKALFGLTAFHRQLPLHTSGDNLYN